MAIDAESGKRAAGYAAATLVQDGMRVGLGTGSTTRWFTEALGERVRGGLRVQAVPTSLATVELATSLNIELIDLPVDGVDIAVDGADAVDSNLWLIKGRGGALVRERVVAASAKRFIVVVDDSKIVDELHGKVSVELIEFGWQRTLAQLQTAGATFALRRDDLGNPVHSDNGNLLADGEFPSIADPVGLAAQLDSAPGVVGHGLFLGMAERVIVGHAEGGIEELLVQ